MDLLAAWLLLGGTLPRADSVFGAASPATVPSNVGVLGLPKISAAQILDSVHCEHPGATGPHESDI